MVIIANHIKVGLGPQRTNTSKEEVTAKNAYAEKCTIEEVPVFFYLGLCRTADACLSLERALPSGIVLTSRLAHSRLAEEVLHPP